jgi:hypothetical protein
VSVAIDDHIGFNIFLDDTTFHSADGYGEGVDTRLILGNYTGRHIANIITFATGQKERTCYEKNFTNMQ